MTVLIMHAVLRCSFKGSFNFSKSICAVKDKVQVHCAHFVQARQSRMYVDSKQWLIVRLVWPHPIPQERELGLVTSFMPPLCAVQDQSQCSILSHA